MTTIRPVTGSRDDVLVRLARIEGQVRGIARMVEQDKYCIDVLTQIAAVNRALQCVALALLEGHMSPASSTPPAPAARNMTPSSRRPPPPSPAWCAANHPSTGR